jgi:hypothetical protein
MLWKCLRFLNSCSHSPALKYVHLHFYEQSSGILEHITTNWRQSSFSVSWNLLPQTKETRAVFGYTVTGYHKLKMLLQSLLEYVATNWTDWISHWVHWKVLPQTEDSRGVSGYPGTCYHKPKTRAVFGYPVTCYHKLQKVEQPLDVLEHATTNGKMTSLECILQGTKKMEVGGC